MMQNVRQGAVEKDLDWFNRSLTNILRHGYKVLCIKKFALMIGVSLIKEPVMEDELWRQLYPMILREGKYRPYKAQFTDGQIVATFLWACP